MSGKFDLKERLRDLGIAPKIALGQNFLISNHVIDKILAVVKHHGGAEIVEIGPGVGALTEGMLNLQLKPRLIELDHELAEYWRGRGLTVIEEDALQINWDTLKLGPNVLLVSNLPYQISTHLVVDRCFGPSGLDTMVLMFQKEVAERLMAKPRTKEYGFLSVLAQLHFRMRRVADAAPADFYPSPNVAGRVLQFDRLTVEGLGPPFLRFVKQAFAFRRKYMLKNLKGLVDKSVFPQLGQFALDMGLSEKVRAEELTPTQFVEFFKKVYEH